MPALTTNGAVSIKTVTLNIFLLIFEQVNLIMLPYVLALAAIRAEGPCDILDAAGNPCVAAHSTTRALYAKYNGPLYNVTRPNGSSKLIGVLSAGGFADKAAHDAFCSPVRFGPLL